ncbi:bifunctional lytic transglycosylase/C40 family peptidase (plasmid) [Streptomyces sp. NBC_01255]|uniref:NlpC/P60 family protein n=1 Tax=Streptomyces sp. NBC_01255 TaxID=2903798 RepID=UPI002E2FAD09|nr:NlpC/P60 family protein [Streptomyces sp. NBC_01255]
MSPTAKTALTIGSVLLAPLVFVVGLLILFIAAVASGASGHEKESGASVRGPAGAAPSSVSGIGPVVLDAYVKAAHAVTTLRPKCKGMRWSVIAGIGKVESGHASGRTLTANGDVAPKIYGVRLNGSGAGGNTSVHGDTDRGALDGDTLYDRAVGPMQFIPATWQGPSGQDGNGDGVKDPHNIFDAAQATAVYLCGTGSSNLSDDAQLRKSVLRYNQSGAYADEVIGHAHAYDQLDPSGSGPAGTSPGGAAFHDGAAGWPASVRNPRSTAGAIGWARQETTGGGRDWYRACLAFVARTYGWSYSGVQYAVDHYRQMPVSMRHDRDRTPPPGALMYWDTGQRAGHVALYLGGGKIASNDIRRSGYIDVVNATDIETVWGATYLGWAPPYFPQGG